MIKIRKSEDAEENDLTFFYNFEKNFEEGELFTFELSDCVFDTIHNVFDMVYESQEEYWFTSRPTFSGISRLKIFKKNEIIFDEVIDYDINHDNLKKFSFLLLYKGENVPFGPFYEIFHNRQYDNDLFSIEKGDVVVDIGCNTGAFVHYALGFNPSKVFCCDADEDCCNLNKKIFKNYNNIFIDDVGIGSSDRKDNFIIEKKYSGVNCLLQYNKRVESVDRVKEVKVNTFKNFLERNFIFSIDFLKIDCEGAEDYIFIEENEYFIKNFVKKIVVEYHDNRVKILNYLKKLNFEVKEDDFGDGLLGMFYCLNRNI